MFWRLAIRNVKRNLNRTLLGIAGMFVAAAIVSGTGAMQSGFPAGNALGYRQGAGGDILVFPQRLTVSEEAVNDAATTWELDLHPAGNSVLAELLPASNRLLVPVGSAGKLFAVDDLPTAITASGARVYPYLAMPALLTKRAADGSQETIEVVLRGRDCELDTQVYGMDRQSTVFGRYLKTTDGAAPVAVLNAAATAFYGADTGASLSVPTIRGVDGDQIIYDFTAPQPVDLEVVGQFRIELYRDVARTPDGKCVGPKAPQIPIFWQRPEIYVTAECWRAIHARVSGGQPIYTGQVGLVTDSPGTARDLARTVSKDIAGSVVTVPDLFAAQVGQRSQLAMPRDMTGLLTILACLIAGLLMAGNVSILVGQRQRELGTLKAIGMTPGEVFRLIFLELIGFSVIGAALGFASMRLFLAVFAYAVTKVPFLTALRLTGAALVRTAVLTLATVLVFGVGPALSAARASTMEVLRSE